MPASVRAGDLLEIRWDALPPEAQEAELVLSLDGGRTFHLHVSPELDPATNRFMWRVPNRAADGAMIGLRTGRRGDERVWITSLPFRVIGDASSPQERVALHEGSAWDPADIAVPIEDALHAAPRASFRAATERASAELPRRPAISSPTPRAIPFDIAPWLDPQSDARCTPNPQPRFLPLRN